MNTPKVRLGDVSVGFVQSLASAVTAHGHDPHPMLKQYGFDEARLGEPRARLSIARYMRLGHSAIQLTQNPALGLSMGKLSRFNQLGLAGITAAQAPTVREAARTLIRFELLYAFNYRGSASFREDKDGAWLRFYSISPYNAYNRFVIDSVLASWISQLSALADESLTPEKIEVEYSVPSYSEAYHNHFRCPIEFGASCNQLRLNQHSLNKRNPSHCPSTWRELLDLCEKDLATRTRTRSLSEQIALILGPLLNQREPDLTEIAQRLKIPSWTLRRKLAEEGTQYREILNNTRRDLALIYIKDTDLAFGEIAYVLGYASAEAFQRAFKRWTGHTPGEWRRSQRFTAEL